MSDPGQEPVINQPVSYGDEPPQPKKPEPLSVDEVAELKGDEVKPGHLGWVALDEEGHPTGAATVNPPEPGVPAARVAIGIPDVFYEVHTPSGAPITPIMNPSPQRQMDDQFLERNPPDGPPVPLHSNNGDVAPDNPPAESNQDPHRRSRREDRS